MRCTTGKVLRAHIFWMGCDTWTSYQQQATHPKRKHRRTYLRLTLLVTETQTRASLTLFHPWFRSGSTGLVGRLEESTSQWNCGLFLPKSGNSSLSRSGSAPLKAPYSLSFRLLSDASNKFDFPWGNSHCVRSDSLSLDRIPEKAGIAFTANLELFLMRLFRRAVMRERVFSLLTYAISTISTGGGLAPSGKIERYKARLPAMGLTLKEDIDYDYIEYEERTFSLVSKKD